MSTPKQENMRIWDALGKTDPAHTKKFTRAGGFKGTAVKPMWANKQMTEFFGPCGIGWGMTEPHFDVQSTGDEILVFCTAGIWYVQSGVKHGPVYGQGGDKVLSQVFLKDSSGNKLFDTEAGRYKTFSQSDDEAFKKAYTDALSNAMKFIGVAADVHMGLFDDSKYVQAMQEEFQADVEAEVERQKANPSKNPTGPALVGALEASVAQETAKLTPEQRAAHERNQLAEKQGIFSLEGDVLHCKIVGIQNKKMGEKTKTPGKEFRSVTFNGRLGNGANFASVFDTGLYEALEAALDKECKLKIRIDGKFANVDDVIWIKGVGADNELDAHLAATE